MKKVNMIISGVGGQGIILLTRIICNAFKESVASEIHGMSQRGGSVISHVRIGKKIYSPTITQGNADMILGLEPVEVLRSLCYVNSNTKILMNTHSIIPPSVSSGKFKYPTIEEIVDNCRKFTEHVYLINAHKLAEKSGSLLTQNIVLLGALMSLNILPLKIKTVENTIREIVPKKYLSSNLKAFYLGFKTTLK